MVLLVDDDDVVLIVIVMVLPGLCSCCTGIVVGKKEAKNKE